MDVFFNPYTLAAVARRLPARLDPLRLSADARRRPRRRAQRRLRQHRRHQRAAHRPQGARRADAAARRAEGHGGGAHRALDRRRTAASPSSLRCWPASPPSSATCFRCGSGFAAARASPPTSACCSASTGAPPSASARVWLLVAALTRYSSLSALVAAVITPVGLFALGDHATGLLAALLSAILIYKHRANIRRLAAGEEPRIGAKA